MNIPPGQQPTSWRDYEQGRNQGSPGSFGSQIQWSESQSQHPRSRGSSPDMDDQDYENQLRRRRSSLNVRIATLRQIGGVNSIDNFAKSWSRAANFHEITPIRPPFRFADDDETDPNYGRKDVDSSPQTGRSLLQEAFADHGRRISDEAIDNIEPTENTNLIREQSHLRITPSPSRIRNVPSSWADSIFSVQPSLTSGFGGSYGTMYASQRRPSVIRPHVGDLFREEQAIKAPEGETLEQEPLLIKQIEEDGVTYTVVVGQSTLPQTIFNSVNVLIGVGLLSLPLGLLYSGWIIGIVFMVFSGLSTQYSAKLLAKCLDVDNSLVTFADLAYVSFGPRARIATSLLFTVELVAACVALIILFADSLNALVGGLSITTWKILCGVLLIPLSFMPLWLLSFSSVLGILCCLGIVLSVLIDGLLKPHTPGSLLEPATTYLFPQNWQTIPLAFGLLMSPWGGHSVFPNIYRDMRHPYKYHRAINITYLFSFTLDSGMAIIGLLMFGDFVHDEITSNILLTPGYPEALNYFIVICIAIIPLTKVPLNARPIFSTIDILTGLFDPKNPQTPSVSNMIGRTVIRVSTVIVFVIIAIIFPSFDRIMTLLGAVCCFSICIVLPLAFHLRLFGHELSKGEKSLNWVLIIVSSAMAIVSTVFACLPRDFLNGKL